VRTQRAVLLTVAAAVVAVACGQQAAPPTPPPSPSLPGLVIDPVQKRFSLPDAQTGTTLRLSVRAVNTDRANGYGGLRVALALQASGGLGQQDAVVRAAPDLGCALRAVGPVASPSDYPGGWGAEYDVHPGGGATVAVGPGGFLGPVCVEVVYVRPGASGVTLEGAFFVYQDDDPLNGRFDLGEQLRSRPLAEPFDVEVTLLEGRR
jgi:hypothetical protein